MREAVGYLHYNLMLELIELADRLGIGCEGKMSKLSHRFLA